MKKLEIRDIIVEGMFEHGHSGIDGADEIAETLHQKFEAELQWQYKTLQDGMIKAGKDTEEAHKQSLIDAKTEGYLKAVSDNKKGTVR